MGKTRRSLYKIARILGDIEAVSEGKTGKRIQRRLAGKMAGKGLKSSGCFVATACYGSPLAEEVKIFSRFRDHYLLPNIPGRILVRAYYLISPWLARFIENHTVIRKLVRRGLSIIVNFLSRWEK